MTSANLQSKLESSYFCLDAKSNKKIKKFLSGLDISKQPLMRKRKASYETKSYHPNGLGCVE